MKNLTRAQKATIAKVSAETEPAEPQDDYISHHRRQCAICNHQALSFIEDSFLQWNSPEAT
jgi:hypothetical protein